MNQFTQEEWEPVAETLNMLREFERGVKAGKFSGAIDPESEVGILLTGELRALLVQFKKIPVSVLGAAL